MKDLLTLLAIAALVIGGAAALLAMVAIAIAIPVGIVGGILWCLVRALQALGVGW